MIETICYYNKCIYIAGGSLSSTTSYYAPKCYMFNGTTWTEITPPPNMHYNNSFTVYKGKMHFMSDLKYHYIFDGSNYTLFMQESYDNLYQFISFAQSDEDSLYTCYGNRLYKYNDNTTAFELVDYLPSGGTGDWVGWFFNGNAAICDNKNIYCIWTANGDYGLKIYNISGKSWTTVELPSKFSTTYGVLYNGVAYNLYNWYYTDSGNGSNYHSVGLFRLYDTYYGEVLRMCSGVWSTRASDYAGRMVATEDCIWVFAGSIYNRDDNTYIKGRHKITDANAGQGSFTKVSWIASN